jgi:hypothetical protein
LHASPNGQRRDLLGRDLVGLGGRPTGSIEQCRSNPIALGGILFSQLMMTAPAACERWRVRCRVLSMMGHIENNIAIIFCPQKHECVKFPQYQLLSAYHVQAIVNGEG